MDVDGSFDAALAYLNSLFGQWNRLLLLANPGGCFTADRCGTRAGSSARGASISKRDRTLFLQDTHYAVDGASGWTYTATMVLPSPIERE
jgi:hypothetical protein